MPMMSHGVGCCFAMNPCIIHKCLPILAKVMSLLYIVVLEFCYSAVQEDYSWAAILLSHLQLQMCSSVFSKAILNRNCEKEKLPLSQSYFLPFPFAQGWANVSVCQANIPDLTHLTFSAPFVGRPLWTAPLMSLRAGQLGRSCLYAPTCRKLKEEYNVFLLKLKVVRKRHCCPCFPHREG